MELLKESLIDLYPPPFTVNMDSEIQIARYIKSLPGNQRLQLGKFFIEYVRSEEMRMGIDTLEQRIEAKDLLEYTNDMCAFKRFKATHFKK